MWQSFIRNVPEDKVPIGHITNGIHLLGWMKGTVRQFWRRQADQPAPDRQPCGKEHAFWSKRAGGLGRPSTMPNSGKRMVDPEFLSDEELWALRYKLRRELIEFARRRLLQQSQRLTQGDYIRSTAC
jgi:glycogen phosphorylase